MKEEILNSLFMEEDDWQDDLPEEEDDIELEDEDEDEE